MRDVKKIVCHSKNVLSIAEEFDWLPGARYTNLRDISEFKDVGLIDIDWKNYSFDEHLEAVKKVKPNLTIAKDLESISDLEEVLEQAKILNEYSEQVIIVPKDPKLEERMEDMIPNHFLFGFSVPTKYGGTEIPTDAFRRPVHLLGGRPDTQRKLAEKMNVVSLDCNRFTLDASFGDYFVGDKFVPHPEGGYENCIRDSFANINELWTDYGWN